MTTMRNVLGAALLAALAGGPALAQDGPPSTEEMVDAINGRRRSRTWSSTPGRSVTSRALSILDAFSDDEIPYTLATRQFLESVERALGWATRGSAAVLGRPGLGQLAPGMQADLALFRLDGLRFSGSHDPVAALLLCAADRADRVMVGGRWRVVDGTIPGLDVAGLIAEHSAAARRLAGG